MSAIEQATGRILRVVCIVLFGAVMLLMMAIVLNRILALGSLDWSDEVVEFLTIWLVFCGSAEVWRMRQHFFVETVPQAIDATRYASAYRAFLALAGLAFVAVFTWQSLELMLRATDESPYFSLSRRFWYAAMPLSGALMVLFSLRELFDILTGRTAR